MLANTAATYDTRSGRSWRPLADTTLDPVIAARRSLQGTPTCWISKRGAQSAKICVSDLQKCFLTTSDLIRSRRVLNNPPIGTIQEELSP